MSYGVGPDGSSFRTPTEDAEEWRSPAFSGDFYREADNVTRGLTFPTSDDPGLPGSAFGKFADSNFYHEPDDLLKGVTIGELIPPPLYSSNEVDLGYSSTLAGKFDVKSERFSETDVPPGVPPDSFFQLNLTSVYVTSHMPAEIGNTLLSFLGEQNSIVTKVRHSKFAIKADMFVDMMMCSIKIRVYSQGSGQFAIEFQKRTGDAIAFQNTFQKAVAYLKPRLNVVGAMEAPPLAPIQPLGVPAGFVPQETDLMPLIDMMYLAGTPSLQAEAAADISKMAAEGQSSVWNPYVFQGIGELLRTSSLDVAHPTSRLVLQLSQQMEAAPLFATQGLLRAMLEKVGSQDTNAEVRRLLSQAVLAAAQRQSKATLSDNQAAELLRAFSDTLRMKDYRWGNDVIGNLEMANMALGGQFQASHWA
jgi:hypothetical protein